MSLGAEGIEIINPETGKDEDWNHSRLSKRVFFIRFLKLVDKLANSTGLSRKTLPTFYSSVKANAKEYQVSQEDGEIVRRLGL